ncbi:hypothetical protein BDV35DRAFT_279475 [Aspergillus flavus]|uniref:Uncharacterized protein n=1 Tax=Aspergillus flavus TaxID=5059 RepID=A0A5N6GRD7_ASPFL|nr:hypothetical protein BDV35DRAFT_279475 [Aspergillus flavus]GMF70088.1 unnamed protein product [Aspergillus oryzae]GMF88022.1 unnamed protein product [Aspergillus oryzae]
MFTVLEELYLTWEYQDLAPSNALDEEEHFFDRIADSCEFAPLKKCTLQNIRTSETALLLFLHKVRLTSLWMKVVFITNGQFESVFHYLSTSMPNLEYSHLYQLFHELGTVYFNAPIERRFPETRDARTGEPMQGDWLETINR